jgi:hypothetical protein
VSGEEHGALRTGVNGGVRERRLPGTGEDAPFTPHQLDRIDEALTFASRDAALTFSLYVGDLDDPSRDAAEQLHARLADPDYSILVAVSPGQRVLQIVTGVEAADRVPNRICALAALTMRAAFSSGDLVGGIVNGVRMLSDAAGQPAHHV